MKFEVGKFYKTRDGRKAQIFMMDNGNGLMLGAVFEDSWLQRSFRKNGESVTASERDLISEWREPIERKTTAWVQTSKPFLESKHAFDRLGIVAIAEGETDKCQTKVEIIVRELSDEI